MSRKFTVEIFLTLSFVVISSCASAGAEVGAEVLKPKYPPEAKVRKPSQPVVPQIVETHQIDEHLKEHGDESEKRHQEMTDKKVHDRLVELHEQLMKLRHEAETLEETGVESERLEELEEQIARKEQERKKLTAHLEHRGKERHFEDGEAEIHKLQGAIKELRYALEHQPDSPKAEEWKKSLHEHEEKHEEKLEWLMAEFHEKHEHRRHERRRRFPEIEEEIERTKIMELMELRHMAEDLREGGHLDRLEEVEHEIAEREAHLEELTDHLEERRNEGRRERGEIEGELAIFRLKHAHVLELGEVIEPFLTHSGVITVYPPGNVLIIRDTPPGLEAAHMIIEALDIPHEAGIHHELKIDR